ncbi:hypothetical protein BGW38_009364, partial [Lunasporangiospora selenospora]
MTVATALDSTAHTLGGGAIAPSSKKDLYPAEHSKSSSIATTTTTTTHRTASQSSVSSATSPPRLDSTVTSTTTTTTTSTKASQNSHSSSAKPKRIARKVGPKMNPIYKGVRALVWALYFNLGASLVSMSQILSLPLAIVAPGLYHRHIRRTEGHFGALLVKMNQLFAPSDVILTGDASINGIVKRSTLRHRQSEAKSNEEEYDTENGIVELDMPERMILISNHQASIKKKTIQDEIM